MHFQALARHIWLWMTSTEAFYAKQHVPVLFLKMKMSPS